MKLDKGDDVKMADLINKSTHKLLVRIFDCNIDVEPIQEHTLEPGQKLNGIAHTDIIILKDLEVKGK